MCTVKYSSVRWEMMRCHVLYDEVYEGTCETVRIFMSVCVSYFLLFFLTSGPKEYELQHWCVRVQSVAARGQCHHSAWDAPPSSFHQPLTNNTSITIYSLLYMSIYKCHIQVTIRQVRQLYLFTDNQGSTIDPRFIGKGHDFIP